MIPRGMRAAARAWPGRGPPGRRATLPLHRRPEGGRGGVAAPSGPRGPQPSVDPPGRARPRRRGSPGPDAAAARDPPSPAPGATALPPAPARRSCWDLRADRGRGRLRGVAASLAILSAPWEGARLSTASAEPRRGARAREGGRRPWAAACGGAIFRGGAFRSSLRFSTCSAARLFSFFPGSSAPCPFVGCPSAF